MGDDIGLIGLYTDVYSSIILKNNMGVWLNSVVIDSLVPKLII